MAVVITVVSPVVDFVFTTAFFATVGALVGFIGAKVFRKDSP